MTPQLKTSITRLIVCIAVLLCSAPTLAKSPLDGSINIINKRDETVQISVDGERLGQVSPRGLRTFRDVPNGLRLISVTAPNVREINAQIQVPVAGRVSFTVVRQERRTTLTNPNNADMWLIVNGQQKRMIRAKSMIGMPMKFGANVVGVRPVGSTNSKIAQMTVHVRRDASPTIQLPIYYANLTVTGTNVDRATLHVGSRRYGTLHRGAKVTLRNIEPGTHRVELRNRGRAIASTVIHFRSGKTQTWSPNNRKRASLRVNNTRARAIQFQINGRRPVTVGGKTHTVVSNLPLGQHEITWRGPRGRTRSAFVTVSSTGGTFTIGNRRQSARPARQR